MEGAPHYDWLGYGIVDIAHNQAHSPSNPHVKVVSCRKLRKILRDRSLTHRDCDKQSRLPALSPRLPPRPLRHRYTHKLHRDIAHPLRHPKHTSSSRAGSCSLPNAFVCSVSATQSTEYCERTQCLDLPPLTPTHALYTQSYATTPLRAVSHLADHLGRFLLESFLASQPAPLNTLRPAEVEARC